MGQIFLNIMVQKRMSGSSLRLGSLALLLLVEISQEGGPKGSGCVGKCGIKK